MRRPEPPPVFAEAVGFKLGCHCGLNGKLPVVVCLRFCRRDIPGRFEETIGVEPRHPFERSQFHRFDGLPRCAPVDQFGLVETIDRFGQSIIVAVAQAADGGFYAGLTQTLAVSNADVLRSSVAVMNECCVSVGLAGMECLCQRIEHAVRGHRAAHASRQYAWP